jgi:predicted TIM-barrel fold metal-dependent hydrolase
MNNIPIFDSLVHPTIDGNWLLPQYHGSSSIERLLSDMNRFDIFKALAVGMDGIGQYSIENYGRFIQSSTDKLLPIAFINFHPSSSFPEIQKKLNNCRSLGYKGIKLHSRTSGFTLKHNLLPDIIKNANDNSLPVLLCTYFYSNIKDSYHNNSESLLALLEKVPSEKIVLLHSGGIKLLEYMEIARAFKSILLDLSFTLTKYIGSSIDLDIGYLFNNFDRRICIGSDFPELSIEKLRAQFNLHSKGLSLEKAKNIAHLNLLNFFNQ